MRITNELIKKVSDLIVLDGKFSTDEFNETIEALEKQIPKKPRTRFGKNQTEGESGIALAERNCMRLSKMSSGDTKRFTVNVVVKQLIGAKMTNEEAIIRAITYHDLYDVVQGDLSWIPVLVESAKKQIRKKPVGEHQCPKCKEVLHGYLQLYCGDCGQAIDWGKDV